MAHTRTRIGRLITGLLLIALGILILLQHLGILDGTIWTYWPAILIVIGIGILARR